MIVLTSWGGRVVKASGTFQVEQGQARILHGVLDQPEIERYELRHSPPPR